VAPDAAGDTLGESVGWSDPAAHKSGSVNANGVRLQYLDWGGSGPPLILIHGLNANPHYFDDLVPALTDQYRVVAYARRGHGRSDQIGPYDIATLTEDLGGLMDGLGIAQAHLAGWSLGGNEITSMAGTYPDRVERIVYLDGAHDWGDPAFAAAFKSIPDQGMGLLPGVSDPSRFEAWFRDLEVIQADGSQTSRMSEDVGQAVLASVLADRRDYTKVRSPALAIYATTFWDIRNGDPVQAAQNLAWEQKYMVSFRAASIERIRRELPKVEITSLPGTHPDLVFTCREHVVAAMRRFLRGWATHG
jgi:pimeloyl-ACP methyl ester carboxylesterase